MSTRGAIGFRSNGVDKVTYNHHDSYPTGRGFDLMKELNKAKMCLKAMGRCFEKIEMTDNDRDIPEGGVLLKYLETLKMYKSNGFLQDSLFCEWAYIVNLDDEVLEIYTGGNKDKDALGRYASLQTKWNKEEDGGGYMGVALVAVIHLDDLYDANVTQIEAVCEYLDKVASYKEKNLRAMTERSEKIEALLKNN